MKSWKSFVLPSFILLSFLFTTEVFAQSRVCKLETDGREWITGTLKVWEKVRKDSLRLPASRLPWLLLLDEACVVHVNPDLRIFKAGNAAKDEIYFGKKKVGVYAVSHDGKISLPERGEVPAQIVNFASVYDGGKKSFLISALPAIWRKVPDLQAEKNLDVLIRGVFAHEMTHTFHGGFHARLDELEKKLAGVENFDDDVIQNVFGKNADFRKLYEREHELMFRAVAENDLAAKRRLAKTLLENIRARRTQFFTAENAVYTEIEEIFLTMEGAANWAAYRAALDQGLNPADALKLVRRSGRFWSQEQGIALFLLIDALSSNWQKKAFAKSPATVTDLLAEAVK